MSTQINLGGANQAVGGGSFDKFVGLGPVSLVAVNPTKARLEEILGTTLENEPNYSSKANDKGISEKPLILWYKMENGTMVSTYVSISSTPITTNAGDKFKFINSVGQISFYAADESAIKNNPNVTKWYKTEGMRKLNGGEDTLYELLQAFARYNPSAEGANWMDVMNSLGITADALKTDVSGLNSFINHINSTDNKLIMSHVVSLKEDDNGNMKSRQQLLTDSSTYFRTVDGEVKDYMVERLRKYSVEKENSGYAITNKEFFVGPLKVYNGSDVPVATMQPENSSKGFLDL